VVYEAANPQEFWPDFYGNLADAFEPLETDGAENVTFFLQPGEGYEVAPDAGTAEVTYYDSLADVPPSTGGGNSSIVVGVTASETELIETEGTETTVTFTLSEPPPPEGLTVFIDSGVDPVVGSSLSQFDVLNAEISGGNFPIPDADASGFFFTITEQTATITLSVFDELSVDTALDPDNFQEGILALDFALQPQDGYTIDPDASEINFRIFDNPDSKIQVGLTASTAADEGSTTLVEPEGTVSIHTFSLGAPPPAEGLTVTVNASSLSDFDLDAIEVTGGSIAAVRDDGFDLTITEQEATVSLPVLDDGVDEGSETAIFTLEPGDSYELNAAATEATFTLVDSIDQLSVPEEVEGNDTLPEANALGLSSDNPVVSLSGAVNEGFLDLGEDVDFYSFNLEAGQTVSLDINTEEIRPETLNFRPVVFPAFEDILQKPDTELRLFDEEGNELAANSDGAAPGEDFSRDPYLEFTASEAGTYYIGVSALGNRNYDPNVEGSGSGWTFPEVGVFFGDYDLTATLVEGNGGGTGGDLTGTDGDDMLMGTDGDDLLDGLLGDDTYTGGAGADQFVLGIAQGVDIITDFEVGTDQISLGGLTPSDVKFFDLNNDTLVLTKSNELIGVVEGVTGLYSIFA
ncbi:MAG: D-alanyl-D-alanine carboxypeptidase, partial [Leptolyngbya sp. SIO4C1]|nr:D-alanyl-D-alanine carboxypeptidase [Leptolyngbya sp. SIO4C1]